MKKFITFLFTLFLLSHISFSQSGWFLQYNSNYTYSDVDFINEFTGFVIGFGHISKTTNGGNNWITMYSDTTSPLYSIKMFDSQIGIVVGYMGLILRTTNYGLTWIKDSLLTGSSFLDVIYLSQDTLLVCGGTTPINPYPSILKSVNGGITWFPIYDSSATRVTQFSSIFRTSNRTVYVVSSEHLPYPPVNLSGRILKTTNGGLNWYQIFEVTNNKCFYSICFVNSETGYASGYRTFCTTTNAGNNWNSIPQIDGLFAYQINFLDNQCGYIGGAQDINGIISCTTDQGSSWQNQLLLPGGAYQSVVKSMDFINTVTGWAVGHYNFLGGVIYKTTNGGFPLGIKPIESEIPTSPSLSQNYPNPFNPVTKIKYDVPPSKGAWGMMTQLIIYDVLGREIETLVNESQKPGSYEVTWDGSRCASGVYFYRLITDDFIETKKMVLIK